MDRIDPDGLRHGGLADTETPVSLGYDRIRFTAPVFLGDTITVTYTITELHPVPRHFRSKIEASNQQGATKSSGTFDGELKVGDAAEVGTGEDQAP